MTDTPRRIQMSRQHPWRAEHPNAVIVARPSRWGNPYKVVRVKSDPENPGEWATVWISEEHGDVYIGVHEDKAEAFKVILDAYRELFENDPRVPELAGRDLACWCKESEPCHGSVLLELANGGARG